MFDGVIVGGGWFGAGTLEGDAAGRCPGWQSLGGGGVEAGGGSGVLAVVAPVAIGG